MRIEHKIILQKRTTSEVLRALFSGINNFDDWDKNLRKIAISEIGSTYRNDPKGPLKCRGLFLGDSFELFVEILYKILPGSPSLGRIFDYRPASIKKGVEDNGVDGFGKNREGKNCVVNIKYRSNKIEFLSANEDHLCNMFPQGMIHFGVEGMGEKGPKKSKLHFIITTAKGLHFHTEQKMFDNRVCCISIEEIKYAVDGVSSFWDKARKMIEKSIKENEIS
jgi:hypothetical protein